MKTNIKKATIYVGNLNYRLQEEDLSKLFGRFGKVNWVRFVTHEDGRKKGIAFIEMNNEEQALRAVKILDGSPSGGRTLKVSIAKNRYAESDEKKIAGQKSKEKKMQETKEISEKSVSKKTFASGLEFMRASIAAFKQKKISKI